MTPRQLAALGAPCRTWDDLGRPFVVRRRPARRLVLLESVVVVFEPAPGGNFVPDGYGGAAWRSSVAILGRGGTLPTASWTEGDLAVARSALDALLEGVGDGRVLLWRSRCAIYSWRDLAGHERDVIPVSGPIPGGRRP